MKIFFSTSPKSKKAYSKEILAIYSYFHKNNITLTDTYIENINIEEFYRWNEKQKNKYYQDTINYIKKADICIFEASYPSLGVGHLIGESLKLHKQVIVLYLKNHIPFIVECANNENLFSVEYNLINLDHILTKNLKYVSNVQDIRFNMMLSPDIVNYMNKVSDENKLSKASYIRQLIMKDKKEREE